MRLAAGILAGQEGGSSWSATSRSRAGREERIAEPLRQMGARHRDDRRPRAGRDRGRRACSRSATSRRWRARRSSRRSLLAGLLADGGATRVVERNPTRDHTERLLRELGVPVARRGTEISVLPVDTPAVRSTCRIAGDFSSAAPFVSSPRRSLSGSSSSSRASTSTRCAPGCWTSSSGWARTSPSSTGERKAASRSPTSRCARRRSPRPRSTPEEVPRLIDELPLVALRRRAGPRRNGRPRRRRAARKGNGPDRNSDNFAQSPWRAHHGER